MSEPSPPGADSFDFARFCDWLGRLRADPMARALLRVILGEPEGADLDRALGRAQRVVAAMTPAERSDPCSMDRDRRAELASYARVHVSDVNELILRYEAAAELVRDDAEVRAMVMNRRRRPAPPLPDPFQALRDRWQRDLSLWEFVGDNGSL